MNRKRGVLSYAAIAISFIALTGCSHFSKDTETTASKNSKQEVEASVTQLTYFDSQVFDQGVINEMTMPNRYILVDFTEDVTLNSIPERIETWLQRVSSTQGTVKLEPVDPDEVGSRGLGILAEPLIGLLFEAYLGGGEDEIDQLASNYNIQIFYMKDSGVINRILFYPADKNIEGAQ